MEASWASSVPGPTTAGKPAAVRRQAGLAALGRGRAEAPHRSSTTSPTSPRAWASSPLSRSSSSSSVLRASTCTTEKTPGVGGGSSSGPSSRTSSRCRAAAPATSWSVTAMQIGSSGVGDQRYTTSRPPWRGRASGAWACKRAMRVPAPTHSPGVRHSSSSQGIACRASVRASTRSCRCSPRCSARSRSSPRRSRTARMPRPDSRVASARAAWRSRRVATSSAALVSSPSGAASSLPSRSGKLASSLPLRVPPVVVPLPSSSWTPRSSGSRPRRRRGDRTRRGYPGRALRVVFAQD